eukprot:scaffold208973_cov31-Prasinocladus_malaysianus.AAC.1
MALTCNGTRRPHVTAFLLDDNSQFTRMLSIAVASLQRPTFLLLLAAKMLALPHVAAIEFIR